MLYLSPILVVLAIYVAHLVRKHRLNKRIAKWSMDRQRVTDEAFYAALGLPLISSGAAASVRPTISDAVQIPKELIGPNDALRELESVGHSSHPSTVDFFEDMWSVASPKDDSALVRVRDFVVAFGPQVK